MSDQKPRVEFVEMLKRLAECPDFIVNGIDTIGPAPDGQSADVHLFVNGERLKLYVQGTPQMYEMMDFAEAAREWLPKLLAERDRLRALILEAESEGNLAGDTPACPWCRTSHDGDALGESRPAHTADCEAFSAPGIVR